MLNLKSNLSMYSMYGGVIHGVLVLRFDVLLFSNVPGKVHKTQNPDRGKLRP